MSRRTSSNIRKQTTDTDDNGKNNSKTNKKAVNPSPSSSFQSFFTSNKQALFKIGYVVIIGFIGYFGYLIYQKSQTGIQNLININNKLLNQTLSLHDYNQYNSLPYLFYCDRDRPYSSKHKSSSSKDNAIESLPSMFTNLNLQTFSFPLNFAILNCSQVSTLLPSSEQGSQKALTIFDKFKLKKEYKPIIWGKSPYNRHYYKNIQATPQTHLKDFNSMKKFIDHYLSPHAIAIESNKKLMKYCQYSSNKYITHDSNDINTSPTCIIILKGNKYNTKLYSELEKRLVSNYLNIRFALIDSNKLRLNHEDIDTMTSDHFGMKLFAIRNGTHYLEMTNPTTWDYMDTFVSHAASVPISDYIKSESGAVSLVKPGALKAKRDRSTSKRDSKKKKPVDEDLNEEEEEETEPVPKKTKTKTVKPAKPQKKEEKPAKETPPPPPPSSDDEDNEEEKERQRLERAERERKIRENMDRQQREHLYDTTDGDEDDSQESEEVDEEEESIIEL